MSGSSLLRRLEVLRSEACLECRNWRGEDLASRSGSDRDDFLGDLEDDLDFVGDVGSGADGYSNSRSSTLGAAECFLEDDFLPPPKNFICGRDWTLATRRVPQQGYAGY